MVSLSHILFQELNLLLESTRARKMINTY